MARTLRFADKGGAIVPVNKQTAQSAGDLAEFLEEVGRKLPKGRQLAGLGVLAAGLPALLEFTDTEDPIGRNAMQAGGRFAGSLGLGAAGAALGQILIPVPGVGAFVGATLGGMLGDQVGAGAMGGLYDAFAGSEGDRRRRESLKDARNETQIQVERLTELMPLTQKLADMEAARKVNMARRNMEIQRDYNFGNTLNTSALMSQQNEANAMAIAMQQLL